MLLIIRCKRKKKTSRSKSMPGASKNIDDGQNKRINRQRDGRQYSLGGREVEGNALIIQYSAQYRGTAELQRQHTFVFHLKQVDIADDASPMPFAGRPLPQFSQEYSRKID